MSTIIYKVFFDGAFVSSSNDEELVAFSFQESKKSVASVFDLRSLVLLETTHTFFPLMMNIKNMVSGSSRLSVCIHMVCE